MPVGIKSFRSQTAKIVRESNNGGDMHSERRSPFACGSLHSGKKIFKFGTATPIVDSNLFEAKFLEHVVAPPTSCVDIDADKQKKILLKVKSVKKSIAKLFQPTSTTTDHLSLSFPPVLQNAKPSVVYCKNVADGHIGDLASTFRGIDGSSSSSASWFSMETESQLDISHLTFDLGELPTIHEEDGNTREVVEVTNARQEELASYSGITVYLTVDTLFEHSTQEESGLVSSEPRRSPAETSLATSVNREDNFHSLPDASRRLRKVPSYEDLRVSRSKHSDSSFADHVIPELAGYPTS
ncbi:hypothetical protein JVU11DRAFT_4313 [Chiua virens]|nr:hypothetical protein JVU11DRAFT_4313 [Chiua virens]